MSRLLAVFLLVCVTAPAADDLPSPTGWGANLEKVGIQDVIAEFTGTLSDMASATEARTKQALTAKGLFAGKKASDFSILTPYAHCNVPYGTKSTEPLCLVGLYLREHAPPPDPRKTGGKRVAWGIVGTYDSRYIAALPARRDLIEKALDKLVARFIAEVTERKPAPPAPAEPPK